MIEKKIYSPWAFTGNEDEKAASNRQIYEKLMKEYRVYRHDSKIDLQDSVDCNFADYHIVIGRKAGYGHALYKIRKNRPYLSNDELALLCDQGNLCFGYEMQGDMIKVFED